MMLIVIILLLVLVALLNMLIGNVFGVTTSPITPHHSVLLLLKENARIPLNSNWMKDVVLNAFFSEAVIMVEIANVTTHVLAMLNTGQAIVIVTVVLLGLTNLLPLLILLVSNITIARATEHVIAMEHVLANVDMNHEAWVLVSVKFVRENQQDVLVMVLAIVMELVLVSKDGKVFLECQLVVVRLCAQITAASMDNVIVVFVFVMVVSNLHKIAPVLISAQIVQAPIKFVDVMANVLAKLASMVLHVTQLLIAVRTQIALVAWEPPIVDGVEMLKSVKTHSFLFIVP